MSAVKAPAPQPSLLWRTASTAIMAATGMVCRAFLYGCNNVDVVGRDKFLALLDARRDVQGRQRGLITVSNHISVLDDPLIWGVLPLRYIIGHQNLRWGLAAHDICYKNNLMGTFFCAGQTLPTHRLQHSPMGGLYQPTINQAIRLLSSDPAGLSLFLPQLTTAPSLPPLPSPPSPSSSTAALLPADPLHYSTNAVDRWPAPAAFASNRCAWVHVFPEGLVHQQRARGLRYFKWGVARLILESEPAPEVVPMFVDGPDRLMPEDRAWPRFLPRIGQRIRVVFGDALGPDAFADLRARWRALRAAGHDDDDKAAVAAAALRVEVAARVRDEVLKLRRRLGYPEEDPALGLADTWAPDAHAKRYRSKVDGSFVNQE